MNKLNCGLMAFKKKSMNTAAHKPHKHVTTTDAKEKPGFSLHFLLIFLWFLCSWRGRFGKKKKKE